MPITKLENGTTAPLCLWLEPWGADYWIAPQSVIEIIQDNETSADQEPGLLHIVHKRDSIVVYVEGGGHPRLLSNGVEIECGHGRPEGKFEDGPEKRKSAEVLHKIRIGMSREQVIAQVGQPDETGGTSRKYRTPSIYKYAEIELHFEPWKAGKLVLAYTEDENGQGRVLLK